LFFFFSSRRRHTRSKRDWSSDVCSSDLGIYVSGGASTVSNTTPPAAIASTTTTIGSGATASNLTIQNNTITNAARAVAVQGAAKIGRASCRERGESSEGAGTRKRKKK